jgi:hypothetical protein
MKYILIILALIASVGLSGCKEEVPEPIDRLKALAQKAAKDAKEQTVTPHEIEMIKFRGELMGKAGLQLYVVFFGDFGQPIDYFMTDGKCTSSNKRLVPKQMVVKGDRGSYFGYFLVPAPSADGTHGSSGDYIYCKTATGIYKEWNGEYYASDRPIELTIEPLVISFGTKTQSQG